MGWPSNGKCVGLILGDQRLYRSLRGTSSLAFVLVMNIFNTR
jgi:hypothetical protein